MLYIIATPIGNLEDITLRAVRILGEVDSVLCEDTRKTGLLLKNLGISKPLVSFFDHNEIKKMPQVIDELQRGKRVALVSSAGTPAMSDPGYKLVRACRKLSLEVTSLPGPSSIVNALALTSLPHEKFIFMGYFPRKNKERNQAFETIKTTGLTAVFFESPYRLLKSLKELQGVFPGRQVAVIREMTKKFEEVKEATSGDLLAYFSSKPPKGEVVMIIPGKDKLKGQREIILDR